MELTHEQLRTLDLVLSYWWDDLHWPCPEDHTEIAQRAAINVGEIHLKVLEALR
jgi:hypothetical protein